MLPSHIKKISSFFRFLVLLLGLILLAGCSPGKVTAGDFLNDFPDADIIQYNGRVYANITDASWFDEEKEIYEKTHLLGEVEKTTDNSWFFRDFSATKLPEGTEIYSTSEELDGYVEMVLVQLDGQTLYYQQQIAE